MSTLLHHLIYSMAEDHGDRTALVDGSRVLDYADLAERIRSMAAGLASLGMRRSTRVAIYLPKSLETAAGFFGTAAGGGIFVSVNPLLKAQQVAYILQDSGAELLLTSSDRLTVLEDVLPQCPALHTVITVDEPPSQLRAGPRLLSLADAEASAASWQAPGIIDDDVVSIFYTSGSTGRPKGVVLSHRNMVAGAKSVASYLGNHSDDSVLAVLPLSFDYGFSQLTTCFHVGARVVLLNYLLPRDVIRAVEREAITGLAGVPPLWIQLAAMDWPAAARDRLRYITNSGGKMPMAALGQLRERLSKSRVFLMYGLTEAFRSTYLASELVDERPTSIGKAIPNVEVMVVRPDGSECDVDEPGELVHRGALVAKGYWRDEGRTAERFRPAPGQLDGVPTVELAVWSGDTVRRDADGFLYFVGRHDEMIKSSGYRVSPTEVEEALYATRMVCAAVAFGLDDAQLGQTIAVVVEAGTGQVADTEQLLQQCRQLLPAFMVPAVVIWEKDLPRNPNGKLDRSGIIARLRPELEQEKR